MLFTEEAILQQPKGTRAAGLEYAVLTNPEALPENSGLYYFDDFISEAEQHDLVNMIDTYPFCEVRLQLQHQC